MELLVMASCRLCLRIVTKCFFYLLGSDSVFWRNRCIYLICIILRTQKFRLDLIDRIHYVHNLLLFICVFCAFVHMLIHTFCVPSDVDIELL